MAGGVITLGEMRAKGMVMLEVACRRCERRGRLRASDWSPSMARARWTCAPSSRRIVRVCGPLGLDPRPLWRRLPELPGLFMRGDK
jgi:hypothetical protein